MPYVPEYMWESLQGYLKRFNPSGHKRQNNEGLNVSRFYISLTTVARPATDKLDSFPIPKSGMRSRLIGKTDSIREKGVVRA